LGDAVESVFNVLSSQKLGPVAGIKNSKVSRWRESFLKVFEDTMRMSGKVGERVDLNLLQSIVGLVSENHGMPRIISCLISRTLNGRKKVSPETDIERGSV
jgi:hypothetical protein